MMKVCVHAGTTEARLVDTDLMLWGRDNFSQALHQTSSTERGLEVQALLRSRSKKDSLKRTL